MQIALLQEIVRDKRYSDLYTFNQLMGDPYPDRKDFANPANLPACKILDGEAPNEPLLKRNLRKSHLHT